MAVPEAIPDSVAIGNIKTMGDMSNQFANMILSNAISNQQQLNIIGNKSTARSVERMDVLNDDEGSINTAGQLAALVALSQQIMKGAQTTLPETGK